MWTSVFDRTIRRASRRVPDLIVGGASNPYLLRWHILPRNPIFNVYLHHFLRSDDPRALHDHPWLWCSILLRGTYVEWSESPPNAPHLWNIQRYRAGQIRFHRATFAHRLELDPHEEVWTLFITGPVIRHWGFLCPQGWRQWEDFVNPRDRGNIGPGCD